MTTVVTVRYRLGPHATAEWVNEAACRLARELERVTSWRALSDPTVAWGSDDIIEASVTAPGPVNPASARGLEVIYGAAARANHDGIGLTEGNVVATFAELVQDGAPAGM